ncbi:DUF3782 domain-containing protein [Candidatus Saccharibacteria bacterium]|nr:DUF3782 domain-containing protein [Candidatus Saccharibacteria bacterium]NIV71293.1 DUF3782 domain-containing protein [Calditrichia bacterium]NIV97778.1 DUF3782 domain-containing protein [Candidatus Saccharibacteria bacterium]NIW80770.1 DUF3782 domain-containing protein [Calditrichia bacterium]
MAKKDIEKNIQEIWELFRETDRGFKETKEVLDRVSHEVAEVSKSVAALTGKWGQFVEGLLAPAVTRLFPERGIEVDEVYQRAKTRRNGAQMEVDLLASDHEYVVAIEVKSSLSVEDVKEHLERLSKFKDFFPRFSEHKLIGAIAGIVIEENADRFAYKSGLFVIGQSGETVEILNDENFKPREW